MKSYDEWGQAYDALVRRKTPVIELSYDFVLRQLGDIRNKKVCDLGCGQGEMARRMALQGGIVTGVDISQTMIVLARSYSTPPYVTYVCADARKPSLLPDAAFDAVVINLMLMDVMEFEAVFAAASRLLSDGGMAVWTIMHPCFESPHSEPLDDGTGRLSHRRVSQYSPQWWRSGREGTLRAALGAFHRPLSGYVNAFVRAGFEILEMGEPVVPKHVPLEPDQESHYVLPPLLGVVGVRKRRLTSTQRASEAFQYSHTQWSS